MEFNWRNEGASLYIPDSVDLPKAARRTRFLGIGAHQDDLEFMCFSAILSGKADSSFSGIVVTDGRGSARSGRFAQVSDEEMVELREEEQREAARLGSYSSVWQLRFPSSEIKNSLSKELVNELHQILLLLEPEVIYTHNPADKHLSHIGVVAAVMAAIQKLPEEKKPRHVYGCEVWRDLDWLNDSDKALFDVSSGEELMKKLMDVFASQIEGGKSYSHAVEGRKRANASFQESHQVDTATLTEVAMDLTPLIRDPSLTLKKLVQQHLQNFQDSVLKNLEMMK